MTTDWSTWGYNPTVNENGDAYYWQFGEMWACANGVGCTDSEPSWTSMNSSPDVQIDYAPMKTPVTIYAFYVYMDQNGNYDVNELQQYLQVGYG